MPYGQGGLGKEVSWDNGVAGGEGMLRQSTLARSPLTGELWDSLVESTGAQARWGRGGLGCGSRGCWGAGSRAALRGRGVMRSMMGREGWDVGRQGLQSAAEQGSSCTPFCGCRASPARAAGCTWMPWGRRRWWRCVACPASAVVLPCLPGGTRAGFQLGRPCQVQPAAAAADYTRRSRCRRRWTSTAWSRSWGCGE